MGCHFTWRLTHVIPAFRIKSGARKSETCPPSSKFPDAAAGATVGIAVGTSVAVGGGGCVAVGVALGSAVLVAVAGGAVVAVVVAVGTIVFVGIVVAARIAVALGVGLGVELGVELGGTESVVVGMIFAATAIETTSSFSISPLILSPSLGTQSGVPWSGVRI